MGLGVPHVDAVPGPFDTPLKPEWVISFEIAEIVSPVQKSIGRMRGQKTA